jgi:hypothetical protein
MTSRLIAFSRIEHHLDPCSTLLISLLSNGQRLGYYTIQNSCSAQLEHFLSWVKVRLENSN